MSLKLVTIGSFDSSVAAHFVCNRLESIGIRAVLTNENVADTAWHLRGAIGGVKLLVAEKDVERARQLLLELDEERKAAANKTFQPWRCGNCQEINEPSFELCWNCEAVRQEVEDPTFIPASDVAAITTDSLDENDNEFNTPNYVAESLDTNPYASPQTGPAPASPLRVPTAPHRSGFDAEDATRRAYRAAIIGLVFCPGICQFYSMYLLLRVGISQRELSPQSSRLFYITLILNVGFTALLTILWRTGMGNQWFLSS